MNDITSLYRYYDSGGKLLYVGISVSAAGRMAQHYETAPWFENLASVKVEKYSNREAALLAEKNAIVTEKPMFNKIHNQGRHEQSSNLITNLTNIQNIPTYRTSVTPTIENESPYGFSKTWPWKDSQKKHDVIYKVITEFNTLIDAQIFMSNNKLNNHHLDFNEKSGKYVIIENSL
jgi:hypothetical protein